MNTEIVVYDNPGALMTRATDVAGVCTEIVKRTAKNIQGRKFVPVEGWQSIAAAYGCVASSTKVERIEGGVRAIGELRRVSDGHLIATAEGFVGEDETTWFGGESTDKWGKQKVHPKRNDFAIRAMAQTRAISRVCRSAFAFVVVLIDSNLSTTPAEEMHGTFPDDEEDKPKRAKESQPQQRPEQATVGRADSPAGYPPAPSSVPPAAGEGPETRDATLTRLCVATGTNKIDLLSRSGETSAEGMSEDDWDSCVRMLKRKQNAMADKVQA